MPIIYLVREFVVAVVVGVGLGCMVVGMIVMAQALWNVVRYG